MGPLPSRSQKRPRAYPILARHPYGKPDDAPRYCERSVARHVFLKVVRRSQGLAESEALLRREVVQGAESLGEMVVGVVGGLNRFCYHVEAGGTGPVDDVEEAVFVEL